MTTTGKTFARVLAVLVLAGLGLVANTTVASAYAATEDGRTVRKLATAGAKPADAARSSFIVLRNLSGLCAQPSAANPTGIGVQLVVAICDGKDPQLWSIVDLGGGRYKLVNKSTGGCMDAAGPYVSGTPVVTWFCGPISNQVWVDGPASPTFPVFAQVRIAASPGLCLTPDGPYGQAGVPLVLRPCRDTEFRQYWFGG